VTIAEFGRGVASSGIAAEPLSESYGELPGQGNRKRHLRASSPCDEFLSAPSQKHARGF